MIIEALKRGGGVLRCAIAYRLYRVCWPEPVLVKNEDLHSVDTTETRRCDITLLPTDAPRPSCRQYIVIVVGERGATISGDTQTPLVPAIIAAIRDFTYRCLLPSPQ